MFATCTMQGDDSFPDFEFREPMRRRASLPYRQPSRSRPMRLERLESRQLLAAMPLGATPGDTGEFLLGTVAVTPVFFESDGRKDTESQNWTTGEIDAVLAKVNEGVNWWSDFLDTFDTVHSLDFVFDDTFAIDPFETQYEPIDRSSDEFNLYVDEFLKAQGHGDVDSIEEGVRQFNHAQRLKLGTDWSFTIFVVDSSQGDGLFEPGGFSGAFAYAGGLFVVMPSTRPASTVAHEMGHIFWALDEYPNGASWLQRRGYYDTQNWNAADNSTDGFVQQPSIMRSGGPLTSAYRDFTSPESTLAMVGWQDSDADGIFDVLDVPLDLQASGYFDPENSRYHLAGTASAVPLLNRNPSGFQSDITLNRISELQYRLDDGPWVTAAAPDEQVFDFDLSIEIDEPFASISWRVIDTQVGVTSETITADRLLPAISPASVTGLAFLDANGNGQRDLGEMSLEGTRLVIRNEDGSPLRRGEIDAAETGFLDEVDGITLSAEGDLVRADVRALGADDLDDRLVFQTFSVMGNRWTHRWSDDAILQATFDQPVGEVSLRAIGLEDGSYARIAAYDQQGTLIARVSSDWIGPGFEQVLHLGDKFARISRIEAYGAGGTEVALDRLEFGFSDVTVTDAAGAFSFEHLADGAYSVQVLPQSVIHESSQPFLPITVIGGESDFMLAPARRVDSPRYNQLLAQDVNRDGAVTAQDALLVINDLSQFGSRMLEDFESSGFAVDANNDGQVTALDALLVVNHIAADGVSEGERVNERASVEPSASHHEATDLAFGQSWAAPAEMFNSTGSDVHDRSMARESADRSWEPEVRPAPVAKNSGFTAMGGSEPVDVSGQPEDSRSEYGQVGESMTPLTQPIFLESLEPPDS